MSSSTPINQLRMQQQQQLEQQQQQQMQTQSQPPMEDNEPPSDMVEEILNDISNQGSNESLNYAMDPSQIPPEKMDINFLDEVDLNQAPSSPPSNDKLPDNEQPKTKDIKSKSMLDNLKLGGIEDLFKKCFNSAKSAIVVFVLTVIVSLPQFNRTVFNKIPSMLSENGQINMKGIVLKGAVSCLLFLVISFFL